jgi:corrinoid protein of di/trimethylamine methyltransferase
MPLNKPKLFEKLAASIVDMDEDLTIELSNQVIAEGIDAYEAIVNGLTVGMNQAGKLFDEEEYFVPELLMCSDAMYSGLNILKPHIKINSHETKRKAVIGVIEGDTHDIGKNLVKIMLETGGYDIVDLGRDVSPATFVERAKAEKAEFIFISTLMTTTMEGMNEVVEILVAEQIREDYKVLIGGGPVSQSYADKIGVDGYAENAAEAVKLANNIAAAYGNEL